MKRTPVSSTLLNSIGYDADKQVLEVEFKNGGLYTHSGVTEEEHENLMSAPSVGGHFAARSNETTHSTACAEEAAVVATSIWP